MTTQPTAEEVEAVVTRLQQIVNVGSQWSMPLVNGEAIESCADAIAMLRRIAAVPPREPVAWLFSGDASKRLWDDINSVKDEATHNALYSLGCHLQRFESAVHDAATQHAPAPKEPSVSETKFVQAFERFIACPPLSVPSDAESDEELCEKARQAYGAGTIPIRMAARIEALNAQVARLDSAWTAMNELQAKEWRRADKAEAELSRLRPDAERLREALRICRSLACEFGETQGYGYWRPENPHDFSPDAESCTAQELAAHKAACEAYDKGEYVEPKGSEWVAEGETKMHILRAPWGIGSYSQTEQWALEMHAAIDAALREPAQERKR